MEPPACSQGSAQTSVRRFSFMALRGSTSARFRCSQHCTASTPPRACTGSSRPWSAARATSSVPLVPMRAPWISLVEQPTTTRSPGADLRALAQLRHSAQRLFVQFLHLLHTRFLPTVERCV